MTGELTAVRTLDLVSVAERVTTELRHAIVRGVMRPGQEFSLRAIAGELGVSFIPVREALRTLEAEGFVETRRGRSALVTTMNPADLAGLCRLRGLIEPDLNARSCSVIQTDDLARLIATMPTVVPDGQLSDDYLAYLNWYQALLAPAATHWEIESLQWLWLASARPYLYAGYAGMSAEQRSEVRINSGLHSLVEAYRHQDPPQVREIVTILLDQISRICWVAFD